MSRKLLIGIIALALVSVGLIIAGAVIRPAFITLGIGTALIGVWAYLAWRVWKTKTQITRKHMGGEAAERRYKMLSVFVFAAGVLLAIGVIGTILHNVLYGINETEEPVSFFIGIVGLFGFVIVTVGGLVVLLKGQLKPA